jgi:dUTPase
MLKVYKLNDKATLPKFATEQSACFDISFCKNEITLPI